MSLETSSAEPLTYRRALRTTGTGLASILTGTGGIGYLLGKQGAQLVATGVSKARAGLTSDAGEPAAPATEKRSRKGLLIGAAAALLAAGGAAFAITRRRKAAPPVAEEPPSLTVSPNGAAPATPVADETPAST